MNLIEKGKVVVLKRLSSASSVMKTDQNKKFKQQKRNYDGSLSAMKAVVRVHEQKTKKAEEHAHKANSRVDLVQKEFAQSREKVHKKGKETEQQHKQCNNC